jgi:hypothetical protein
VRPKSCHVSGLLSLPSRWLPWCSDQPEPTRIQRRRGPAFLDHAAAFFFLSAQRFFMARPIFLRAATDRCRVRP